MATSPFVQVLAILFPFLVWFLATDYFMNKYAANIDIKRINKKSPVTRSGNADKQELRTPGSSALKKHPLPPKPETDSDTETKYVIIGGSGFIGSWIARILILRDGVHSVPDITVLDQNLRMPPDLVKYSVKGKMVDATNSDELRKALEEIISESDDSSTSLKPKVNLVIFNVASIQRHFIGWRPIDKAPYQQNIDMATALVDALDQLTSDKDSKVVDKQVKYFVINFGDAQSDYEPVPSWWKFWQYKTWIKTINSRINRAYMPSSSSRPTTPKYLNAYAQSKQEAEEIILSPKNFTKPGQRDSIFVTSLKPQGIVSGYYGETIFTPALYYGAVIDHSWSVPISIMHVEDVVRAALFAERALIEASSSSITKSEKSSLDQPSDTVLNSSFIVSNGQVLRFGDDLLKSLVKSETIHDIRVNPILALVWAYVVNLFLYVAPQARDKWKSKTGSIHSGIWWSMTPERFNTIQTAQIPNEKEIARTRRVLGFDPVYGIEETVQSLLLDHDRFRKSVRESVKAEYAKKDLTKTNLRPK